jgi:hypothetical protein
VLERVKPAKGKKGAEAAADADADDIEIEELPDTAVAQGADDDGDDLTE